jgi:hypothetical protein
MKPNCISVFRDRTVSCRSTVFAVVIAGEMPHFTCCMRDETQLHISVPGSNCKPHKYGCFSSKCGRDATLYPALLGMKPNCKSVFRDRTLSCRSTVVAVAIAGEMPHFTCCMRDETLLHISVPGSNCKPHKYGCFSSKCGRDATLYGKYSHHHLPSRVKP